MQPQPCLRLDHIVIAVRDLAQVMLDYRALGFTVLTGGQHPGRTSHNALVVLADGAYLEFIAWQAPALNERWYRVHAEHGDGLVDFALLPNDTAIALAAARARGLTTLTGPLDGSRLRPDGERLQWQTARHATPDLPFLCGDITPRALRVPEGEARRHENGAQGVASLAVAVQDLDASLTRYQALLGRDAASNTSPFVLPGSGLRLVNIPLGTTTLVLMTPASHAATPQEPEAARALRQRLATRGEGPCALTLRGNAGQQRQILNAALFHGVALELSDDGPSV